MVMASKDAKFKDDEKEFTGVEDWFDGTFIVLDDGWNDESPVERRFNVKGACMLNKITEGYIDEIFLYDGTGSDNVIDGGLAVFVSVDNEVFTSKAIHDGRFTAADNREIAVS